MTAPNESPRENRTSAMPLVIVGVLLVIVFFAWGPYLNSDKAQSMIDAGTYKPAHVPAQASRPGAIDPPNTVGPDTTSTSKPRQPLSASDGRARILRTQVVDADTGEALPAFEMYAFANGAASNTVVNVSDKDGFCRWPEIYERSQVAFRLRDHGRVERRSSLPTFEFSFDPTLTEPEGEWSAGPFVLQVRVGPTCLISAKLPDGYQWSDFTASLTPGKPYPTFSGGAPPPKVPVRNPHPAFAHPELPWIRFTNKPSFRDLGWVQIESSDGLVQGGAWLPNLQGRHEEPLQITLRATTRLTGAFIYDSTQDQNWAELELRETAASAENRTPRVYSGWAGKDGTFAFENIAPGTFTLMNIDRGWYPWEMEVSVQPGENSIGKHELRARRVAGPVSGRIICNHAEYTGACHISLGLDPGSHDAPYDQSIDFETNGAGQAIAEFAFEDVTEGEWFLYVHCHDGFQWSEQVIAVQAPATDLVIEIQYESAQVVWQIADKDSGESLNAQAKVDWWCQGHGESLSKPPLLVAALQDPLRDFHYRVSVPGYQPVAGTEADFVRSVHPGNGEVSYAAKVMLEPGWGCLIETRDRSRGGPVPMVGVWLDGDFVGQTDEQGKLLLSGLTKPKRLRLEKSGWRWTTTREANAVSGEFDPGTSAHLRLALEEL